MVRKINSCFLLSAFCFLLTITRAQDIPSSIFGNYEGEVQVINTLFGIDQTLPEVIVKLEKTDSEADYILSIPDLDILDMDLSIEMDNVIITPFEDRYNLSRAEPINFIIPALPIPPIPIILPGGGIFYDVPAVITLENSNIVGDILNLNIRVTVTITIGIIPLPISFNIKFEGAFVSPQVITSAMEIMPLSVYPNPTAGELRIKSYEIGINSIEIFDMMGKMQKVKSRKQEEGEIVIDISYLPAGVYFLQIGSRRAKIVKL